MRLTALAAMIWLVVLSPAGYGAPGDYMTPDLRARVEALKVDAAETPTNATNLRQRATTFWNWINAYSNTGRYVPVNATQLVSTLLAYSTTPPARFRDLDRYINEFKLLDEEPNAIGELVADLGPFEARTFVMLSQTYTVGARPIETGGGLLIARHFMPNYGVFQATDPKADNYVSITSSNRRVKFARGTFRMSGMHGGFRGAAGALVFRVASGRLEQGDTVTITYGDATGGSRGLLMASMSSDRMPFPVYLDFDGSDHFFSLPIQPIVVTGSKVAGVHAFAPSVVAPDEPFEISIRAEDRYYNRAKGPLPVWQVAINGERVAQIAASMQAINVVEDVRLSEPGVYRVEIASADGAIVGQGNPILVEPAPKRRIYWGDTHGHSGFAEGIGTPDRFMTWARDDARLDYVTHSEHDIWMDDHEWKVLRENVRRFTEDGRFVAYLGYEWTIRSFQGGHHNVLFRTPERRLRIPAQTHGTLSALYQGLRSAHDPADVVVIPHAHQAGDYRSNDPMLEPLIEIMSQHGTFEWFARMYLNHGHQVGFIAASDNHLSQPGYTAPQGGSLAQRGGLSALLANDRSVDGLFDAMKDLAAYATTGDRIILDVSVNGAQMGQRIAYSEQRAIRGRVIGTAPIDTVTVVRNDEEIWSQSYLEPTDAKMPKSATFLVTFRSESQPLNPGDNPRGWRAWAGTLKVDGAGIVKATGTDFHSALSQSLALRDDGIVEFRTFTRGETSSIELALENIKRSATIGIELEEAREFGSGPPVFRQHQLVPAAVVRLDLADLANGTVVESLPIDDYVDTVTLRRTISDGPTEVEFALDDIHARQGDYYYVRVRQSNDALAWSSPIWVGGYPKR